MNKQEMATLLRKRLSEGKVSFTFLKKNNDVRPAVGSTNPKYYTYERKGTGKPAPDDMIVYWDFEKDCWRSFHESQLLSIDN